MNAGLFDIQYGAPLAPRRVRYRAEQGSSQNMGEAVVLRTTDDMGGISNRSRGAGSATFDRIDMVLQLPTVYRFGYFSASTPTPIPGSFSFALPDGTIKGGNARGIGAVDLQTSRNSASQVASGAWSFAAGSNCEASAHGAVAIGSWDIQGGGAGGPRATGNNGAAFGAGTHASGTFGPFAAGLNSTASGGLAPVVMGYGSVASGSSSVALGYQNTASGQGSFAVGENNTASGVDSVAIGGNATTRSIQSAMALGFGSGAGTHQVVNYGLRRDTTDATQSVLTATGGSASTTNIPVLPNNSAFAFRGTVVARVSGGDAKMWVIEGLIKRAANAASTALVGTPTVTSSYADAGASAWALDVVADTTNGGLNVRGTGAASTTIRWACRLETAEAA